MEEITDKIKETRTKLFILYAQANQYDKALALLKENGLLPTEEFKEAASQVYSREIGILRRDASEKTIQLVQEAKARGVLLSHSDLEEIIKERDRYQGAIERTAEEKFLPAINEVIKELLKYQAELTVHLLEKAGKANFESALKQIKEVERWGNEYNQTAEKKLSTSKIYQMIDDLERFIHHLSQIEPPSAEDYARSAAEASFCSTEERYAELAEIPFAHERQGRFWEKRNSLRKKVEAWCLLNLFEYLFEKPNKEK